MIKLPKLSVKKKYKSIALLTSGGDAPGMNAAIRAVVRSAIVHGCEVYGITKGYSGLLEGMFVKMDLSSVANIIQRGGTVLKTDRCAAFFKRSVRKEAANLLMRKGIDALVVIGGDGSFTGAHLLEKETKFPVIGIPGTIDNDIYGSDDTIGFDTAVNTAIEAIDKIRDTASSHDRLFLVEVMGRMTGFIAVQVGIGGGAETILVPEQKISISELSKSIERSVKRGKTSSIVVVAEGPIPGGTASALARELAKRGYHPRACILGHIQRGGVPSAHDRLLASALGSAAVSYLLAGKSDAMVGVVNDQICLTPFAQLIKHKKPFPLELMNLAQTLAT